MSDAGGKFTIGWFRSGTPVDPSRLRAALAWARSMRGKPYNNGITETPEPRLPGDHLLVARLGCGHVVIHCPQEPAVIYLAGASGCEIDHHSPPGRPEGRPTAESVRDDAISISEAFRANQAATENARRIVDYLADDKPLDPSRSNETPVSVGSSGAPSNECGDNGLARPLLDREAVLKSFGVVYLENILYSHEMETLADAVMKLARPMPTRAAIITALAAAEARSTVGKSAEWWQMAEETFGFRADAVLALLNGAEDDDACRGIGRGTGR